MPATALINGINYDWGQVKLVLFGVQVTGILKIDYKRKQKKENNYGAGYEPVSRGYGMREYEGSIELYQDEWINIIKGSPNRDPLQIPPFDIQVIYGNGFNLQQDTLKAVEFQEDNFDAKSGDTKLTVTIPLAIGLIVR